MKRGGKLFGDNQFRKVADLVENGNSLPRSLQVIAVQPGISPLAARGLG